MSLGITPIKQMFIDLYRDFAYGHVVAAGPLRLETVRHGINRTREQQEYHIGSGFKYGINDSWLIGAGDLGTTLPKIPVEGHRTFKSQVGKIYYTFFRTSAEEYEVHVL